MSDPIEEALIATARSYEQQLPVVLSVPNFKSHYSELVEALAVLRDDLADANYSRQLQFDAANLNRERAEAAEARLVSLKEALREIAEAEDFVDVEDVQAYARVVYRDARAALASSEGDSDA